MIKKYRTFVGDFETSVYEGQKETEVWASALVELNTEQVFVHNSIEKQLQQLLKMKGNLVIYYHNLKFDGMFWLDYFLNHDKFKPAWDVHEKSRGVYKFKKEKDMFGYEYSYMISEMGQFYSIKLKHNKRIIEFRDSLKIIPLSVEQIGKSYNTKHKKLSIEYKGERHANQEITDEERKYIENDVLVVKEALEIFYAEGHTKSTIGSNCLSEYKSLCKVSLKNELNYDEMFVNLKDKKIDKSQYGYSDADAYIRKAYKGGWCYVVPQKKEKIFYNGLTADVNSLYPSMMHSESGNRYPIGYPNFWTGEIPDKCGRDDIYYFVRFKCRFEIKDGYLPTVQIKDNLLYKSTEWLTTSDYIDKRGVRHSYLIDSEQQTHECKPIITMTKTDFILFKEHYNISEMKIIDGCWFYTQIGIFDEYIDKYSLIKKNSTGGKRQVAKSFLNNLYGKLATSDDSSFKIVYLKDDGSIGFKYQEEHEKNVMYIPAGCAITSYARNFTIRTAQKNFYGVDKRGFIYGDTDSIHCDLSVEELKGMNIHSSNFQCWSIENEWDYGYFVRQKTYIEHNVKEDTKECSPYYNVKCAGMNQLSKNIFIASLEEDTSNIDVDKLNEKEKMFLFNEDGSVRKRTITDFKVGLTIPSKLRPRRIKGGIILEKCDFTMR